MGARLLHADAGAGALMDARSIRRRLTSMGIDVSIRGEHGTASIVRPLDEDSEAWMTWLTASVGTLPGLSVTTSLASRKGSTRQLVTSEFCIAHESCL